MEQDERALTTAQVAQAFVDGIERQYDPFNMTAMEMFHIKQAALDRFHDWLESIRSDAVLMAIGEELN